MSAALSNLIPQVTSTDNVPEPTCLWVFDSDGYYETECGDAFELNNEDTLAENRFRFCFYCGKRIKEVRER